MVEIPGEGAVLSLWAQGYTHLPRSEVAKKAGH